MKLKKTSIKQFIIRQLAVAGAIGMVLFLFSRSIQAQTSAWTIPGSGFWSDSDYWSDGVPDGSGQTADFSQVDITATTTVTLDSNRTVGSLIFGDSDPDSAASWILKSSILTLDNGDDSSTVTVNALGGASTAKITSIIAGTNGWVKDGPGFLILAAANTFSGGVTIKAGTLAIDLVDSDGQIDNNTYILGNSNGASASLLIGPDKSIVFTNAIQLGTQAAGTLTIGNTGGQHPNFLGPIDLNGNNLTVQMLTGTSVMNVNGGITGTGNVILDNSGPTSLIECIGGSTINNSGTITVQGTSANIGVGTEIQNIGSNVTALYYNTSITPLTLGPTGSLTVNSNGTAINSASTKSLTLPTLYGTGNLILNANSTGNITVTNVDADYSGEIINSGAGAGMTMINGAITTAGLSVAQNSSTSPMILSAANTYGGGTSINAGSLALTNDGSITDSTNISIAAGATLDVSGLTASTFTLSDPTTLSASGTGTTVETAATIIGQPGGILDFGSIPITLNYDGSHPALYIPQGTLSLNGNAFIVNSSSPLAAGTYTIVQQANGNIASTGTYLVSGTAIGSGSTGTISISGGNVNLMIGSGGSPSPAIISSVVQSGGNLIFVWAGGTNQNCLLLTSVNIAQALADWTTVTTNAVGANGLSTNNISINTSEPQRFYLLVIPN